MPNWCENKLTIQGDKKQIALFKKGAKIYVPNEDSNTDLSLNQIVPTPPCLKYTEAPGDNPNWYDWCIENWSTKWDISGAELIKNEENELIYDFETAWSPPEQWLKKASKLFKKLTFTLEYEEPGAGFAGTLKVKNGRTLMNEDRHIN